MDNNELNEDAGEHLRVLNNTNQRSEGSAAPYLFATIVVGNQGGPWLELLATLNISLHLPWLPPITLENQTICIRIFLGNN